MTGPPDPVPGRLRALLLVLDSVGIGAAPDAARYGDEGANTLAHTASAAGPLRLPVLSRLGLGNIAELVPGGQPLAGVPAVSSPQADFGAMCPVSEGKDTTTGHWEIAGIHLVQGLSLFPPGPPSFPAGLVRELERQTGRAVIGNRAASGTAIIEELGARQIREGCWIVYTSADSVLQIAAHEDAIPLSELYHACTCARTLCDALRVGRVIARPYTGSPGAFQRTTNRRDYSLPPPFPTVLDRLSAAGIRVTTVGKIDDVFDHRGMTDTVHVETSREAQDTVLRLLEEDRRGLLFVNLIDFDMLYGHRRDAAGYAAALEQTDAWLDRLLPRLQPADLMMITADHGNDPTFRGTDHTREYVPILVHGAGRRGRSLGVRQGFLDVAASLGRFFNLAALLPGRPFAET